MNIWVESFNLILVMFPFLSYYDQIYRRKTPKIGFSFFVEYFKMMRTNKVEDLWFIPTLIIPTLIIMSSVNS